MLLDVGIAILPRLAVEAEINSGKLVEVLVKGMKIEKTLRLVYRREASLSHAAKSFLEIVKEQRGVPVERKRAED